MQNKDKDLAESNVVKSNIIIQNARFELSTQEQKVIAYICSKIDPRKPEQDMITLSVQEFIGICELQSQGGNIYSRVKKIISGLVNKKIWVKIEPTTWVTIGWIDRAWIYENSGEIKLEIDKLMKPYLYDLKQRFTQYQLKNILKMNSRYAIQLFELFKSYEYRKIVSVSVNRLKQFLMIDNIKSYDNFGIFNQKVISVAIDEINKYSDITITYEVSGKAVRKITELTFFIERKDSGQPDRQSKLKAPKTDEPHASYDISILDGIGLLD